MAGHPKTSTRPEQLFVPWYILRWRYDGWPSDHWAWRVKDCCQDLCTYGNEGFQPEVKALTDFFVEVAKVVRVHIQRDLEPMMTPHVHSDEALHTLVYLSR